jgi:hypothetical protein
MAPGRSRFDQYVAVLEAIEARDADKSWDERFVFRPFDRRTPTPGAPSLHPTAAQVAPPGTDSFWHRR